MSEHEVRLQAARAAIRRGEKARARELLRDVARENPRDFRVWLLLAGVASSAGASLDYLDRAEQLQPGHPTIARARSWAEERLREERAAERPPPISPARPRAARKARPEKTDTAPWWRRPLVVATTGALLLLLLVAGVGWTWGNRYQASRVTAQGIQTAAPTATLTADDDVLRVQFWPRSSAAITATPAATPTAIPRVPLRKVQHETGSTPRPTWTVTPSPTPTPTATPTLEPTFVSPSTDPQPVLRPASVGADERWIDVNLTQQRLVAYEGDTPVFESLISSGTWNHPTVTGQFRVWLRLRSQTMDGRRLGYNYYLENVPYVMYFYEDYALHGTYWHNNFGTPMSHGCVNLPTPAAEWIFNWSTMGTLVFVHY